MTKHSRKNIEVSDQHSEQQEKKPKVVLLEEYKNYRYHKKDFLTNTMLEKLGHDLIDWAYETNSEDGIKIQQFLAIKGISEKNWFDWCAKYEPLKEAAAFARMIIGNRRESGMMTRKYADGPTNFMMPLYDSSYREMLELKAKLASKNDEDGGTKVVVIEKYAEVPEVPRRNEE